MWRTDARRFRGAHAWLEGGGEERFLDDVGSCFPQEGEEGATESLNGLLEGKEGKGSDHIHQR